MENTTVYEALKEWNETFIDLKRNGSVDDKMEDLKEIFRIPWLTGIFASTVAFFTQLTILMLVHNCRKFDEVVLCQMSCARIINSLCELSIIYYVRYMTDAQKFVIFIAYYHSDVVLLCWMCLFTKNLYNKIVIVFHVKKHRLMLSTFLIWCIPLALSVPCPFLLAVRDARYFSCYNKIIFHVKFIILAVNAVVFGEILRVAFHRDVSTRSLRNYIKSAIVGFILVCITSLQVLIGDLISQCYGLIESETLIYIFCIINSCQVVAFTIIFILLVRGKINETNSRPVRFSELSR